MSISTVAQAPGLFTALRSIYGAVIAATNLVPKLCVGTEHLVDAYGHLTKSASLYTEGVEIEANYENRIKVLDLERKFQALEAKSVSKLKAA